VRSFVDVFVTAHAPLDEESVKEVTGLSKAKITRLVQRLSEMGAVECSDAGVALAAHKASEAREIVRIAAEEEERLHEAELERIERMRAYAELLSCRREYLLRYFGEDSPARCEFCDNCERTAIPARAEPQPDRPPLRKPTRRQLAAEEAAPAFPLNTRVFHSEWGLGVVRSIAGDGITILFDTAGEKTLSLRVVRERGLLEKAG